MLESVRTWQRHLTKQWMNQEIQCLVFFQNLGDVQPSETWDSFQETCHEFWVTNLVAGIQGLQVSRLGCGHFQTHQAFRNMSMEASVAAFSWSLDVNARNAGSTLTIIAILGMLVPRYPPLNCGFSILQHPLSTPFFKARFEIPGLNRHHKWCCKMYFGSPLECSYWPNPKTLDRPWSGPSRDPISRHRFGCHHRNGWDCKTTSVVGSWQ